MRASLKKTRRLTADEGRTELARLSARPTLTCAEYRRMCRIQRKAV